MKSASQSALSGSAAPTAGPGGRRQDPTGPTRDLTTSRVTEVLLIARHMRR